MSEKNCAPINIRVEVDVPPLETDLQKLTSECEKGNGVALKDVFDNTESFGDRVRILEAIDSLNAQRRETNKYLPDLELSYYTRTGILGNQFFHIGVYHNPAGLANTSRIYHEYMDQASMKQLYAKAWKR